MNYAGKLANGKNPFNNKIIGRVPFWRNRLMTFNHPPKTIMHPVRNFFTSKPIFTQKYLYTYWQKNTFFTNIFDATFGARFGKLVLMKEQSRAKTAFCRYRFLFYVHSFPSFYGENVPYMCFYYNWIKNDTLKMN